MFLQSHQDSLVNYITDKLTLPWCYIYLFFNVLYDRSLDEFMAYLKAINKIK